MASGWPPWAQGAGVGEHHGYGIRRACEVVVKGWTASGCRRGHGMRRAYTAITEGVAATELPLRACRLSRRALRRAAAVIGCHERVGSWRGDDESPSERPGASAWDFLLD